MGSKAIPFRLRHGSLDDALECYRIGDFQSCVLALHGLTQSQSINLGIRAWIRLGRPERALDALMKVDNRELTTAEKTENHILRSFAYTLARDFERAEDQLDQARVFAFSSSRPEVEAEYQFSECLLAFSRGDYQSCVELAGDLLEIEATGANTTGPAYFISIQNSRVRAYIAIGMVEALRQRYDEQLRVIHAALDESAGLELDDQWLFGNVLQHLAVFVRDFALLDDAEVLRKRFSSVEWPLHLNAVKFDVHRALGWCSSLHGDELNAFREFRFAGEAAPTVPHKILAAVDRAYLSRELGEKNNAFDQIDYAARLSKGYDWETAVGERIALAQLAQEVAAFSPSEAKLLFDRYRRIKSKLPPNADGATDRRPRAYERMAEGTVLRALGQSAQAIQAFFEAFDIWTSVGNAWRSATASLELAELTGSSQFVQHARQEASRRPNSWLARRCDALVVPRSSVVTLPIR